MPQALALTASESGHFAPSAPSNKSLQAAAPVLPQQGKKLPTLHAISALFFPGWDLVITDWRRKLDGLELDGDAQAQRRHRRARLPRGWDGDSAGWLEFFHDPKGEWDKWKEFVKEIHVVNQRGIIDVLYGVYHFVEFIIEAPHLQGTGKHLYITNAINSKHADYLISILLKGVVRLVSTRAPQVCRPFPCQFNCSLTSFFS